MESYEVSPKIYTYITDLLIHEEVKDNSPNW